MTLAPISTRHARDMHWDSLVDRALATPVELAALTADERLYYVVRLFEGEVNNGGFEQYFYNSAGGHFHETLVGLKLLGANNAATLLKKAARVAFADGRPPVDQIARWNSMRDLTTKARARTMEQLEEAFFDNPDKLDEKLALYAEEKGLLAPFVG